MTRDEAIKLRMTQYAGSDDLRRAWAAKDVDNFVALGMIKLDEPRTVDQRIDGAMKASLGVFLSQAERIRIKEQMDICGLKIVEK